MAMSESRTEEYTEKMRGRYARMTGRRARTRLLDEFSAVTGWERKHANKVLLGLKRKTGIRGRRGAPKQYDPATVEVLKNCWLWMDQPCGKRMKDMLPLWLGYLKYPAAIKGRLKQSVPRPLTVYSGTSKFSRGKKRDRQNLRPE